MGMTNAILMGPISRLTLGLCSSGSVTRHRMVTSDPPASFLSVLSNDINQIEFGESGRASRRP
jgi:hypothetical protein